MTNFTKKQQAEAQFNLGKSQSRLSKQPASQRPIRSKLFPKGERKRRLALSKAAARNMVQGTIKKNRIKQGLPRPPAKKQN